eukprot:10984861-Alexandrium_andersonii.AAC.1
MHENARLALALVPHASPGQPRHLHVYLDGGAEQVQELHAKDSVGGWAFAVIGTLPSGQHACCGA